MGHDGKWDRNGKPVDVHAVLCKYQNWSRVIVFGLVKISSRTSMSTASLYSVSSFETLMRW